VRNRFLRQGTRSRDHDSTHAVHEAMPGASFELPPGATFEPDPQTNLPSGNMVSNPSNTHAN